jgi:hypothetical protein
MEPSLETEREAKDYLRHYVYDRGDWEAAGNLLRIFGLQAATYDPKTLDDHKRTSSPAMAATRWSARPSRRTWQAGRHRRRRLPDLMGKLQR